MTTAGRHKQAWTGELAHKHHCMGYLDKLLFPRATCLGHTPSPFPPVVPLSNLLSGGPFLFVPVICSKPEGENLSNRVDLKSAAMFNLNDDSGRASAPRVRSKCVRRKHLSSWGRAVSVSNQTVVVTIELVSFRYYRG